MRVTTTSTRTARTELFRLANDWPLLRNKISSTPGEPHVYIGGVATGEEAFSLAMILEDAQIPGRITATDVDPELIERAIDPVFSLEDVVAACDSGVLPRARVLRHLRRNVHGFVPSEAVRRRIEFGLADLSVDNVPRADIVMLRNMWRHLGETGRRHLASQVYDALPSMGVLAVGGSDLLTDGGEDTPLPRTLVAAGLRPVGHPQFFFRP